MATSSPATPQASPQQHPYRAGEEEKPEAVGHPLGLYALFMTEMWERFSYYGMRALLVIYMLEYHGFQPKDSSGVYKWYTSLVYLTPLLGGFLADRFLGLRWAIIVGGVLMAVGHFLMAFEPLPIFYVALAFLIAGNGFFKPNISTMVGRMYGKTDPRRDGAFTIFYMGINLGAFFAPQVCGWLRHAYGFHTAFTAAGIGMGIGLAIFLLSQKRIIADVRAAGNSPDRNDNSVEPAATKDGSLSKEGAESPESSAIDAGKAKEISDDDKPGATGIAGLLSTVYPILMILIGIALPAKNLFYLATGLATFKMIFMPTAFALISLGMGIVLLTRMKGAARDKSTVIFILFVFLALFWMAFEQSGNTLAMWAEYFTDRGVPRVEYGGIWAVGYAAAATSVVWVFLAPVKAWFDAKNWKLPEGITKLPTPTKVALVFAAILGIQIPILFSKMTAAPGDYSAEDWQSVNAVMIVVLAPLFSMLWVALAKRGKEPSTPQKMGFAMVFVSMSFVSMTLGAMREKATTSTAALSLEAIPKGVSMDAATGQLKNAEADAKIDGGRLKWDREAKALSVQGVMPQYVVNEALKLSLPKRSIAEIEKLVAATENMKKGESVQLASESLPCDFKIPDVLSKSLAWSDHAPSGDDGAGCFLRGTLRASEKIDAPAKLKLMAASAPMEWREAVTSLQQKSKSARVSGIWLFLSYLFATIGELCLSPVGLSMVTKLAPARFASLFMGVWLLGSSVAQYAGGTIGEFWQDVTPTTYFSIFVGSSLLGAMVLFLLVFPVRRLMHGVK